MIKKSMLDRSVIILISLILIGCGGGSSKPDSVDNSNANTPSIIRMAIKAPESFAEPFCVRLLVTGGDISEIRSDRQYPSNTQIIETVMPNIPVGIDRKVEMGIFKDGTCADLANADWYGIAEGIVILNSEVTVVSLDLMQGKQNGIGSIVIRGDRSMATVRLHGEVIAQNTNPIAQASCDIMENGNNIGNVLSRGNPNELGVLDTDVEVAAEIDQLLLDCSHPNFRTTEKIANRVTDPTDSSKTTFVATVVMIPIAPVMGTLQAPTLETPTSTAKIPVTVKPEILNELGDELGGKVMAHFPGFDGDRFFISLPVAQVADVSSNDILNTIVEPVLEAIGFSRGSNVLALPPDQGINQARADLFTLAQFVANEAALNPGALRPKSNDMLSVMLGLRDSDSEIDAAFSAGEGMTFTQYKAGIERLEIQYPFLQVDLTTEIPIPIEHTLLLASRWEGQTVTSIRGALYNQYVITNSIAANASPISQAIKALTEMEGIDRVVSKEPERGPDLVLLPYGSTEIRDDTGGARAVTQMRYAYRMVLQALWAGGMDGMFLLWLDAQDGNILKLDPLVDDAVNAAGVVWNRDPGVGSKTLPGPAVGTGLASHPPFRVDDAVGGQYTLKFAGAYGRVDYLENGFDANDVSISDSLNGSTPTFANFDQVPINDETNAGCLSDTNKAFQQVNLYANLYDYRRRHLGLGIFTPFPESELALAVESMAEGCNAWSSYNSSIRFGACGGYSNAACPNYSDGTNSLVNNAINFSDDNTIVVHELAHQATKRYTNMRPSDWCGMVVCSMPVGWNKLHDLADFWSDTFESTNCGAGWVAKNMGGVDNSLNCANHNEMGGLPRLHQVAWPFDPTAADAPGDHFPEHRTTYNPGSTSLSKKYSDMQIATAALWQVRLGMRSKCRWSGLPQFEVRFARALKNTGFFVSAADQSDRTIYQYIYDLEVELAEQWATSGSPGGPPAFQHNGPHTMNKVTAGFAKVGLFLIPPACLDGDAGTFCLGGESGADAVIDIEDNDAADDTIIINDVVHPEQDFLELAGASPTFHVWTGPRYRLDGVAGVSTLSNPAPCNVEFQVEASSDPTFPVGPTTVNSAWIAVDTNPATAASPECHGTWSPDAVQWTALQSGGAGTRIYYRATTRDAVGGSLRVSTDPGNGLWTVPAPYAVITADGQSDY